MERVCRCGVVALVLVAVMAAGGCGKRATDRVMPFERKPDAIADAKSLLQAYAAGQPVGSETMGFDELVGKVAAADAAKGKKFKDFIGEVKKRGVADAAKAKKLLAEF